MNIKQKIKWLFTPRKQEKKKGYTCPKCGKQYNKQKKLIKHIRKRHK